MAGAVLQLLLTILLKCGNGVLDARRQRSKVLQHRRQYMFWFECMNARLAVHTRAEHTRTASCTHKCVNRTHLLFTGSSSPLPA